MFEQLNEQYCFGIVIPAQAGIHLKTPGFRLKAGMTVCQSFIENVRFPIQSSIKKRRQE
jgi:hypothetical protein